MDTIPVSLTHTVVERERRSAGFFSNGSSEPDNANMET